mmetsp:Transcript_27269/g.64782  ORF Transcript_27269/g.64782 Transcript_27269/m.64782 type:complete len:213 (-) Transcript_27269:135-773(-)
MSRPVSPPRGLPSTSSIGLFPASRGRRDSMLLPPDGRAGPGRGPGGPLPEEEPPRRPPGGRTRPSSTKALLVTGVAWSDMAEDTLDRAGVEVLCILGTGWPFSSCRSGTGVDGVETVPCRGGLVKAPSAGGMTRVSLGARLGCSCSCSAVVSVGSFSVVSPSSSRRLSMMSSVGFVRMGGVDALAGGVLVEWTASSSIRTVMAGCAIRPSVP